MKINMTLGHDVKLIDDHISSFLHHTDDYGTKVIGFEVEWPVNHNDKHCGMFKCAILQFCYGNSCLIIRLGDLSIYKAPDSLHNFLRMPKFTFVGFGIKDNLAYLEKYHGIGCRNAVELGPLAASLLKVPRLSYCGVDELAFVVCKLDLRKYRPLSLDFNWGVCLYEERLVKLATVNVYSYYKIGNALLGSNILTAPVTQIGLL
ncbi:hypothetical protein TSUD_38670 [Trifolium subterraneum]|uniref:3'-5' exonuclease domain-containing protein n=1 Tax=Trifolium subterraneum TaxID=3900 RepID=A0A2Z6NIZ4_TRISU|nr:hypothetical protein TSUD_38670 [Trifolium subterraneum]